MERLEDVNAKYSDNAKDLEQKYLDETLTLRETVHRLEKEHDKIRRSNSLLAEEAEQLKAEHAAQLKTNNEYRIKFIQLASLQSEYDSLSKEYERLLESHQKL